MDWVYELKQVKLNAESFIKNGIAYNDFVVALHKYKADEKHIDGIDDAIPYLKALIETSELLRKERQAWAASVTFEGKYIAREELRCFDGQYLDDLKTILDIVSSESCDDVNFIFTCHKDTSALGLPIYAEPYLYVYSCIESKPVVAVHFSKRFGKIEMHTGAPTVDTYELYDITDNLSVYEPFRLDNQYTVYTGENGVKRANSAFADNNFTDILIEDTEQNRETIRHAIKDFPYDHVHRCKSCSEYFFLSARETAYFLSKDLKPPKTCPQCRARARRARYEARRAAERAIIMEDDWYDYY